MQTPMQPDTEWMKTRYGDLMFEIAQVRGIAGAVQQALAASEKAGADKDARIVELSAEVEKLRLKKK